MPHGKVKHLLYWWRVIGVVRQWSCMVICQCEVDEDKEMHLWLNLNIALLNSLIWSVRYITSMLSLLPNSILLPLRTFCGFWQLAVGSDYDLKFLFISGLNVPFHLFIVFLVVFSHEYYSAFLLLFLLTKPTIGTGAWNTWFNSLFKH